MKYSCKQICHFVLGGLISHVGTLLLIILYLIGGGYLFIMLELDNEQNACAQSFNLLSQKLNDTTTRAIQIGAANLNTNLYYNQLYGLLYNFSKDVYTLNVSPNKNCTTLGQPNNLPNWNLANSIFFCATIITTIGYGQITPSTQWGRVVCIVYGFVGIPLMLLFLGNFGELLARAFRFIYMNLCCCQCFIKAKYKSNGERYENQTNSVVLFNEADSMKAEMLNESKAVSVAPPKMAMEEETSRVIDEYDEEEDDDSTINIPLTIVTGVLILYMFCGAFLFMIWEDWDIIAGIYFSFITVSTIGFGDLYPAKNTMGTSAATLELLLGSVYCVVGLAILSMCLSLMKDEIVSKFQWLGSKLGLSKSTDSAFDENEESNQSEDVVKIGSSYPMRSMIMRHSNDAYESSDDINDLAFNMKVKSA